MSGHGPSTAHLEHRIAELEALLKVRDDAHAATSRKLEEARAEERSARLTIEKLEAIIARLKRLTFGKSSEKLGLQIAQLELALEELEEQQAEAGHSDHSVALARSTPIRKFPDHLPRHDVVHKLSVCSCPDCGDELRRMGEDSDGMLDVVPVSWRVLRHLRPKYTCRACSKIVQAAAPARAIARDKATFDTLAHIVVSKHDHHLPLHRQSEMMAAQGIDIDRSTLARWSGQAASLLDPIVSRIREEGLKASKIHCDDTPVPVLDPGRGRTATGRLWTYVVDECNAVSASPPLAWYRFTPTRSGGHVATELASFTGYLQANAYAGYDQLYRTNRFSEVGCWDTSGARYSSYLHARRRRSPPICSAGSRRFTTSRRASAASRPTCAWMSASGERSQLSTSLTGRCSTPCAGSRPRARWPRPSSMAPSAGLRSRVSSATAC